MIQSDKLLLKEINFEYLAGYKVAGMAEPWRARLNETFTLLKNIGIGAILTLTEDDLYCEKYTAAGFLHLHEPIDDCCPPAEKGMHSAISFIDKCLAQGHGVAVHCLEGRGRTGTVLCAWIALKENLGPDKAITRIHNLRPCTVLTESQRDFLKNYIPNQVSDIF